MMIKELHDAVLSSIRFDWEQGELRIYCQPVAPIAQSTHPAHIVAYHVEYLHVPHELPWGPSASINDVKDLQEASGIRVRVEMQSGDVIDFLCKRWSLTQAEETYANA